jgi:hypothetical protein
MTTYTFAVDIITDTAEHARQVMIERLAYDEVLVDEEGNEFDYNIEYPPLPFQVDGEVYE